MPQSIFRRWFPLAVTITLLSFLVYVTGQMQYRAAADDPQEQLAIDAAARLTAGEKAEAVTSPAAIDLAKSEGVFVVVYDNTGKAIAGNVQLNGAAMTVPIGTISYALEHGDHHVSWQPKAGVREALDMHAVEPSATTPPYVVVVGRSLRSAEYRIGRLGFGVIFGWGVTMLATFVAVAMTIERKKIEIR